MSERIKKEIKKGLLTRTVKEKRELRKKLRKRKKEDLRQFNLFRKSIGLKPITKYQ